MRPVSSTNPIEEPAVEIDLKPITIRGQTVILDHDLAALYGVPTKQLNQQVKRNRKRFPADFVFQLSAAEARSVRPLGLKRGEHTKYRPYVFTELGAGMLASVLRGRRAVRVSIEVLRAFARHRAAHERPPMTDDVRKARSIFDALTDALLLDKDDIPFITETRFTYFLQAGTDGPIKIGSTKNLAVRMRTLQLMSPAPLRLLGVVPDDIEDHCHCVLGAYRIHGEWFLPDPRVLEFIRKNATVKSADLG